MSQYLLHTDQMVVGYDHQPLIGGINIGVKQGEILTLIGPNGAGKSTILKSLTRQLELLGGKVILIDRDMAKMSGSELARKMALVATERIQTEMMSCLEVVSMGRYPYTGRLGILTPEDHEKAAKALEMVNGSELADKDFMQISDGQRQRVMLARALCQEPDVIILDEPTSFLDIRYKLELLDILKTLAREDRLAVIMSLHELDLAQKISDRVMCVNGHRIDRYGVPEEIFTSEYIHELYHVKSGTYNSSFGSLEFSPAEGPARVFVIGGGGSGIPIYRKLQRAGIAFAAGVLHCNDLDWPVADALAECVISEKAFEPISDGALDKAIEILKQCDDVVCTLDTFGQMNEGNRRLLKLAEKLGKLRKTDEI